MTETSDPDPAPEVEPYVEPTPDYVERGETLKFDRERGADVVPDVRSEYEEIEPYETPTPDRVVGDRHGDVEDN